jgi:hypothetical protein
VHIFAFPASNKINYLPVGIDRKFEGFGVFRQSLL